jgi:hypothetical protein
MGFSMKEKQTLTREYAPRYRQLEFIRGGLIPKNPPFLPRASGFLGALGRFNSFANDGGVSSF